jgi:hypothetical protein
MLPPPRRVQCADHLNTPKWMLANQWFPGTRPWKSERSSVILGLKWGTMPSRTSAESVQRSIQQGRESEVGWHKLESSMNQIDSCVREELQILSDINLSAAAQAPGCATAQ